MNDSEKVSRKRLFISLLSLSMLLLIGVFVFIWWLIFRHDLLINIIITETITVLAVLLLLVLASGLTSLVWTLLSSRSPFHPKTNSIMKLSTTMLFPFSMIIGRVLGWDEDRIKNSFIQVSNQLVKVTTQGISLKKVLILAPHCIQWVNCPYKITVDIHNCKECGKCQVGDLIRMSREYNIGLLVVTGGTLARKAIKEFRPQAVVAIACERDLTSGIKDIPGIPVIGIINERPQGPCCNTCVDLEKVRDAVVYFISEATLSDSLPAI
ncbi:MAG: DUF116 domain-containing protein [Clostridia bacterium]|jgi:hypothetical protein|nr:DUF116 domain-containing protein [Clostridia bacterium]